MSSQPVTVSVVSSLQEQALDAAPVAMVIVDTDLRFLYVNPAMVRLDGVAVQDHIGRRLADVLPQVSDAQLAPLRAVAAGGGPMTSQEIVAEGTDATHPRVFLVSYRALAGPDGAPAGVTATVVDVTEERRRTRYLEALQQLASALGRAMVPEDVASTTLDVVLGTLGADRGAVSLVAADGRHLDVVGFRGYRPGELTPARLRRRIDAHDPLADVSRTGELLLFETDAQLTARYPGFERRRPGGGALAAVGMPPQEVPTGGIILAWPDERTIGPADRTFLEACSRLTGQALHRVRAEMTARRRAEGLARTLAAIAGEVEPESIAQALLREAMPGAGARWGAVRMLTEDGTSTRLLYREGFGEDVPAGDNLPLDADSPSVQAIRDRREVLIPDLEAAIDRWPGFLPAFLNDGQRASASVPMVRGSTAVGCLTLGFDAPQAFDESQLSYVRALAEATTSALERARLSAAEIRSRQLLTETLDQLPIGVLVAEPTGGLVFQNQEVGRILGEPLPMGHLRNLRLARTDMRGQPMGADDWPIMRALRGGETVIAHESLVERQDGQAITVRTTARPVLDAEGRVVAAVSVFADVTRERAVAEAREAFLGVLSHELRTPVTAIYGGAMLLARHRDELPVRLEPVVEDVGAESMRLLRLVEDLLVIARVERGLPVATCEPLLVQHVLRRVVAEETRRWPDASFAADIAPNLPPVLGDSGQLEVVVRNLLGNAAKYGGQRALVTARATERGVVVSVEDEGPGLDLPPEQLFRLFQRGRTATRRASGSGIGLFVCRALVEGMGGRIWAENLPDAGAAFRFVLGRDDEADPA